MERNQKQGESPQSSLNPSHPQIKTLPSSHPPSPSRFSFISGDRQLPVQPPRQADTRLYSLYSKQRTKPSFHAALHSMPPAIVGLASDPKPMDRPNPLSRPHLVKLRRRGGSVSRAPKPPVSGYNPFCPESESDPVQERIQSWRPFDSGADAGATFSGPGTRESSPQDPPVTSVFGFSSSTNADAGSNSSKGENVSSNSIKESNSFKGSGQTGLGPFIFGNATQKSPENNLKDGKENKPVFVFGASENSLGPSNLPERMQTWHPFNSGTETKGNSNQDGAFVFGEKSNENPGCQEEVPAENGTLKQNGSSGLGSNFTFEGGTSVPEGKDATLNADSLREKLEKTVHISSSSVPEEKVESAIGNFPKEKSDCSTSKKEEARCFVPGSDEGSASMLPEEMKKLNLQNAKTVDGSQHRDADVLPEKVERLNLGSERGNLETKTPVFVFGVKLNENTGSSQTSSKSTYPEQFIFGSSANTFSDNMNNINTSKERASYTPGAFSFNFRDWEPGTKFPEMMLPDAMKKLEIGARKTAGLRDKKGKRKPTKLGKSTTSRPHGPSFVPEHSDIACSSEKDKQVPVPGSPAGYSPMECSPYPENYASDDTHRSTSLEAEAEVDLTSAAEQLEIKEESPNENEKPSSKEVREKETRGEGVEVSASGTSLNLDGSRAGPTFTAFNTGNKEEAREGMDYVGSSYVDVEMGNTASGSSFRFTSSTSVQGPVPIHRRHFRRKNRVTRGPVESTEDQVMSSFVQPSTQWSNESTPPGRTRIDLGRQEVRSRMEAKKETARTSGVTGAMSGSALEACEKWRMRYFYHILVNIEYTV